MKSWIGLALALASVPSIAALSPFYTSLRELREILKSKQIETALAEVSADTIHSVTKDKSGGYIVTSGDASIRAVVKYKARKPGDPLDAGTIEGVWISPVAIASPPKEKPASSDLYEIAAIEMLAAIDSPDMANSLGKATASPVESIVQPMDTFGGYLIKAGAHAVRVHVEYDSKGEKIEKVKFGEVKHQSRIKAR